MVSTFAVTQCATSLWRHTPCNTHVPQAMHKAKKIITLTHVNNNHNKN